MIRIRTFSVDSSGEIFYNKENLETLLNQGWELISMCRANNNCVVAVIRKQ